MATHAVEVVYRGIFQRTLARNIVRQIVFAARKDGKIGTALAVTATHRKEMASPPNNSRSSVTQPWSLKKAWQFTRQQMST